MTRGSLAELRDGEGDGITDAADVIKTSFYKRSVSLLVAFVDPIRRQFNYHKQDPPPNVADYESNTDHRLCCELETNAFGEKYTVQCNMVS